MQSSQIISRKVLLFVLFTIVLLVGRVATPSPAKAATPTDGRINLINWGNGNGAIAVYCVDQFDHPGGSFTGGGIKILSAAGQKLFFAAERLITPAQTKADKTGSSVLILKQGVYSLYALPNGYFQINSTPDNEGKTFIARWYGCSPVGPGPDAAPAGPVCVPFPIEQVTCQPTSECLNFNNGDPNCDGKIGDANDRSYCESPPTGC